MKTNYVVVDVETTVRSPIGGKGHPAWPDNHIVMLGVGDVTYGPMVCRNGEIYDEYHITMKKMMQRHVIGRETPLLVGHNIKYDLLYLLKDGLITPKQMFNCGVWDTQIVEYLLSAQTRTYPSLDDTCVKYGGVLKDTAMADLWDAGVQTECFPMEKLSSYLRGDLRNTELTYLAQRKKVEEWGMMSLVEAQMLALLGVTMMEHNGMAVDIHYINSMSSMLAKRIEELEAELLSSITFPADYGDWSWSSVQDMSRYLFGGLYKVAVKEHIGYYKNGKDKYKSVIYTKTMKGVVPISPSLYGSTLSKLSVWSLDDSVLKNIVSCASVSLAVKNVVERLHDIRLCNKQRETYYENLKGLVFPSGKIHANLSMVSTKTGRLSCNKPNIQNQTVEGGIKDAYVSRWGDEGVLLDIDYSQLEMAALAILANDEQMINDINGGVDMHTELYRGMYGRAPTKDERKKFKSRSFGLVYGAGAKTLAENAGCSLGDAKLFIKVFYDRYKGVASYHETVLREARDSRILTKERTTKGLPVGMHLRRIPTGRLYVYKEYDNEWKGGTSFSPTELKNWAVQGFATGDIVPFMVGVVCRTVYKHDLNEHILPIMTVHDSIVFDVKKETIDSDAKVMYNVLMQTSYMIQHHFGIEIPVKLSVECSVGSTWGSVVPHSIVS